MFKKLDKNIVKIICILGIMAIIISFQIPLEDKSNIPVIKVKMYQKILPENEPDELNQVVKNIFFLFLLIMPPDTDIHEIFIVKDKINFYAFITDEKDIRDENKNKSIPIWKR